MEFIETHNDDAIATVVLKRGKVNALNEPMVEELGACLKALGEDPSVRAVILTGSGKFFSFGFDIPEFLGYSKESFVRYLTKFTKLCTAIFLFSKPIVAAINGHAVAGGCMLVMPCDYRIMAAGKGKIALNEITFGASVFAGSADILKHCVGSRNAELILTTGAMYTTEEAQRLGMVDDLAREDTLMEKAKKTAAGLALRDARAFGSIKRLLRKPVADAIAVREKDSILEFVEIWYSEATWKRLQDIKIHG